MDWWDHKSTEEENLRLQIDGLRGMGEKAVAVFRQDLRYDPAKFRMITRFPFLERLMGGPWPGDSPEEVRRRAVFHLGQLGKPAQAATPDLLALASDPDGQVRRELARTLGSLNVNSPEVQKTLETMLKDSDKDVRFSAALALWELERSGSARMKQVAAMITPDYLAWPSHCLKSLGPKAAPFAPTLRQVMLRTEWSKGRPKVLRAVWFIENDRFFVLSQLASLEAEVRRSPGATNARTGWTDAEGAVGDVTQYLIDQREFRNRLRPMLHRIRDNPGSKAHRFATTCLQRFDQLDRRDTRKQSKATPHGELEGTKSSTASP